MPKRVRRRVRMWFGSTLVLIVAAGVALAVAAGDADWAPPAAGVAGAAIWLASCRLYARLLIPKQCREMLESTYDPAFAPPDGTASVNSELAQAWAAAVNQRDWRALRGLMPDDFKMVSSRRKRTFRRRHYVGAARQIVRAYPDVRASVEQVTEDPAAPGTLWLRLAELGHSRHGPDIDAAWWERWALDAARGQIREAELIGVARIG